MPKPMPQSLSPAGLAEIRERIREAGALSLFLDFDGTLAPIVNDPGDACLAPEVRTTLAALAARSDTLVAFISGRELADLRLRVGIANAIYAGNHGLEISGLKTSVPESDGMPVCFVEPGALVRREALRDIVDALRERLAGIPGARLEDKVLTASIHYRQAAAGEVHHITEIVHQELARSVKHLQVNHFRLNHGKMVLEIVPRTDWNKGAAVGWINARLATPGARSIYIGDDRTDEDAFALMTDEITIRVGRCAKTSARYFVKDPAHVHAFLEWLSEIR
jgi:trehalose 6-phosphate phosphatase